MDGVAVRTRSHWRAAVLASMRAVQLRARATFGINAAPGSRAQYRERAAPVHDQVVVLRRGLPPIPLRWRAPACRPSFTSNRHASEPAMEPPRARARLAPAIRRCRYRAHLPSRSGDARVLRGRKSFGGVLRRAAVWRRCASRTAALGHGSTPEVLTGRHCCCPYQSAFAIVRHPRSCLVVVTHETAADREKGEHLRR